jgi:hypothetical protein
MSETRNSSLLGKFTVLFVICCLVIGSFVVNTAVALDGSGTEQDPWLIQSLEDFNDFAADANYWDDYTRLETDVNLAGMVYDRAVIAWDVNNANHYFDGAAFTGFFDGDDHKITNLSIDDGGADNDYLGLFGYIGEDGEVSNLGLEGGSVRGDTFVGGLVGTNGGTISNCYATGDVSGILGVGGLVGGNYYGIISNCYSTGDVNGDATVGGLIGNNENSSVSNCYSTGDVSGTGEGIGGLAGANWNGTVSNCYSTGNVNGVGFIGGLVGYNFHDIINCYSTGDVNGVDHVGGLVGRNIHNVSNSFWDTDSQTHGITESIGSGSIVTNVEGLPTAQMQDPNTFMDAGWDLVGEPDGPSDIWAEPSGGGYPILWWQLSPLPPLPDFSGGTGEPNKPYLISTATELNSIGHNPRLMRDHFQLINDIDLTGINFFFIGSELFPFSGVFDGNDYTISNFTYDSNDRDYIGLFGCISGDNALIEDLGLIDPNLDAGTGKYVGSLVVVVWNGTITNCYAERGSVTGYDNVGGLVAYNRGTINNCYSTATVSGDSRVSGLVAINSGTINNCYSTATVSGRSRIGGLVAENSGTITNCYSIATVSSGSSIGGLVGRNYGIINDCYATGSVSGIDYVGGLVGWNSRGTITSCYSTGKVAGTNRFGGLVARNYEGTVTTSFWDIETSGQASSVGGTGLPTAEMQMQITFTDAGWDFITPIWKMNCEGMSYPKLSLWQPVPGDFLCPDGVDFIDYSFFASHWAEDNCGASNDCDGRDLDLLGSVDIKDLRIFVDNWLAGF